MKPQFIRDTTTEIKKGKEGTEFIRDNLESKCKMMRSCCSGKYNKDGNYENKGIKIHDFINISPYMKENLIPDENGLIIIKDLNLEEYSFLHILCFDNISCNEDWFYLKNGKTSLRDLRAIN